MKNHPIAFLYIFFSLFVCHSIYGQLTVQSVDISQVDTFALRGYQNQPVLKVHIKVNGTSGNLSLQQLTVHSLNQSNTDIDSIELYVTTKDRFSLADYPGEATLVTARHVLTADSSVFTMNYPLDTGDNYIWVTMDVDKNASASHTLDAQIKQSRIEIGGNFYPASDQSPTGTVSINQVYFSCNFEDMNGSDQPVNWTQQITGGGTNPPYWVGHYGGYGLGSNAGHPIAPMSGNLDVMFEHEDYTPVTGMLTSAPLDLSLASKPVISFYHSQVAWCKTADCSQSNNDELRVFYKVGTTGTWNLLSTYTLATPNSWIKREIQLPDAADQSNIYLGFQGTAQYGWGVCLDSLVLYESVVVPMQIYSVVTSQPNTNIVPQNSINNPILRVDVRIKGNTGSINLDSLTVTSANTSDADIAANGVSLYYTNDSVFSSPTLIGTPVSIADGKMRFKAINRSLESGENYYWVCYNASGHATPGDTMDAKILAGDIHCSIAGTYPNSDLSPSGLRIVKQTAFFDDFETDKGWSLTGEFQRGKPEGKGGLVRGNPDPTVAYSDSMVLGTDLSGLGATPGDYETNLTDATEYTATSPLIDGSYYKNLNLSFYRYLNVGNQDSAVIEYQIAGQSKWHILWSNQQNTLADNTWNLQNLNISDSLDRQKFYLRFRLGPTGPVDTYSGWNIDYLFITGDTITRDVAVTKYYGPVSSCDLTSGESVKIAVKNTGPSVLSDIPVEFSLDHGKTFTSETIPGPLAVGQSLDYTFSTPADFSKPAYYSVIVKTSLPGDDYIKNDSLVQEITSIPNYTLPYSTGFEKDTTFWTDGGLNSSWHRGWPEGSYISQPASGNSCWKTDNEGKHNIYEYSYIQSPCFNLTGNDVPMIDMMNNYYTASTDGAIVEYSLDEGSTWNYVSKDTLTTTPWVWYNDSVPTLSHLLGWTGRTINLLSNQEWRQDRQVLPSALANQTKVMFRVVFKSDSSVILPYEGFAFDDVKIYDAPFDIGAKAFVGLSNPGCQFENSSFLKVAIQNYGLRTMQAGDTIIVGVKADTDAAVIDTFRLTSSLARNDTVQYRMTKPVAISEAGTHSLTAFTLIEKDPYFYSTVNNDTTRETLVVNPNPVTGLPDTVYSAQIDTLVIQAVDSANYQYAWSYPRNGYTTNTSDIQVSQTGPGNHFLTVTNQQTSCKTNDSVFVKILVSDVGVDSIISPVSNCGYGTGFKPVVELRNYGTDTLRMYKRIPVNIQLDSNPVMRDTVVLDTTFAPNTSIQVTLNTPMDLSAPAVHNIVAYTSLASDTIYTNDTIRPLPFQIYGYPTIDLGSNIYRKALSYTVHAPSGFSTYAWDDHSTADSLVVTSTGTYHVTVTDINNCPAKDSVHVRLAIHDFGVKRLIAPVSSCALPDSSTITCKLMNYGTDTLQTGDTAIVKYSVDTGAYVTDTLLFSSKLLPHDSMSYSFSKKADLSAIRRHSIEIYASVSNDLQPANDTLVSDVDVFGNPVVDLGPARNVLSYQYVIDPGSGYASYFWQDSTTNETYVITKDHYITSGNYKVKVTDQHGCAAADSTIIYLIDEDLEVSQVILPANSCTLGQSENIGIKITNVGNKLLNNRSVVVKYQINNNTPVVESYTFSGDVGSSSIYTFNTKADLSAAGSYKVFADIQMSGDVQPDNDTLTNWVQVSGTPVIDFGALNDTIKVNSYPYTLDAGAGTGYTYQWSNSATSQTTDVSADGLYKVIVTTSAGCQAADSVYVQKNVSDLSVTGYTAPVNACSFPTSDTLGIELTNTGNTALLNKAVTISYQMNSGDIVSQNVTFTGNPFDKESYLFDQPVDLSATGTYVFTVSCSFADDAVASDNSSDFQVINYGFPVIDFGVSGDTIKASDFPVILNPGENFAMYLWNDSSVNSTYSVTKQGEYTVKVTDVNQCSSQDSIYVEDATPVQMANGTALLSVYPNPVTDVLYVDVDLRVNTADPVFIELYTSEGKLVTNRILSGNNFYHEMIPVNSLAQGMYYVRVHQHNWVSVHKIIVK